MLQMDTTLQVITISSSFPQGWCATISTLGDGDVVCFPSMIHTKKELVRWETLMAHISASRVLTMLMFGASVLHPALNDQHHFYSYAPHRPTTLSR